MPDLLIELFSEEIPARMQARAADDLKSMMTDRMVEAGLTYAHAAAFATPRRLTLAVEGLTDHSPATREERKGPRVDAPEKALEGFLRSTGLSKDQLEARDDKKGQVWFATIEKPGRPAEEIVAEALTQVIEGFPWPKSMRWGEGSLRWVRPLHSILCILTDEEGHRVVPVEVAGYAAGDTTEGHRFLSPGRFRVSSFDDYAAKLKRAHVILDPEERRERIRHEAQNLAFAQGLEVIEDNGLLAEVAGLVEWPVPLMGEIGAEFMELPPEVLQTSMKEHQKFFSVRDRTGKIVRFLTVANIEAPDDGAAILAGNGRVLRARLSDAKFFWENDLAVAKDGMGAWTDKLANVTFHNKLGSQKDRIERIAALAREIAPMVGAGPDAAGRAALIAKADLSSEMVYEFPELQGLMGRYYAEAAGLPADVAAAAEEHYRPLGPSDDVPTAPVSVTVALADKLDTLTGFWAIDEKPTGSKDPFALRRAALGVIRLVTVNGLRLPLQSAVPGGGVSDDLLSFFHDRLKVHLRDRGIRHDVIDAVLAMPGSDDLALVTARAEALAGVLATDDGENLVQGFKRANNLLTQAEAQDGVAYEFGPDEKFAEAAEEKALFKALDEAEAKIGPAMEAEDFGTAMEAMAALRAPIDAFFEAVQINTDNQIVRRNRLNLLHRIRQICLAAADLTRIEG
ncbi:glycine--tRNA ligase subunit beta [Tropicimonas sp. IMCC34011]|uniref:glycine--tRNA ligase subunit beta n=1 Tax=Tropicimonas sp. IMCC34011 TaxID=2248759 RepID=UPI000E251136|nr:glycine--tRNA ligase subunit beta [Tropicimonas sp. IMCC34011]